MQSKRILVIGPLFNQVIECATRKNKTCKVVNSFEIYQSDFSCEFVCFKYNVSQMKKKYPLLQPKCQQCWFVTSSVPPFNFDYFKQIYKFVEEEMPVVFVGIGFANGDKLKQELIKEFSIHENP